MLHTTKQQSASLCLLADFVDSKGLNEQDKFVALENVQAGGLGLLTKVDWIAILSYKVTVQQLHRLYTTDGV